VIRSVVTLALLAATAWYVLAHPPANLAVGRGVLAVCPVSFGPWNGTELSFEDAVVEELAADDLLVRRYQQGDATVWLCVVYHQNRRYGAHDPKLCYESQGYAVDPERRMRIPDGTPGGMAANRFVADRPGDRRVVYYWWSTQGLTTADAAAFRNRMALSGALENRSWGAFVRVEAQSEPGRDARADSIALDFAGRVAAELPRLFAAADQGGTATP
jgi:EpsI family protein